MVVCPKCGNKKIQEMRQNYVSVLPTGNNISSSDELLTEIVDVYRCQLCGFSWKR